jgi:PKD repeat protein
MLKNKTFKYTANGLQTFVDKTEALIADKPKMVKAAQGTAYLSLLSNLMLWLSFLMELPDWAKIVFGTLVVLSIGACIAFIYFSKDRHAAVYALLDIVRWIIEFLLENQPPAEEVEAAFVASPLDGSAPLTVSFNDRSTGTPTYWTWSFGDGEQSSLQHPTHVYTTKGTYTVTLTARRGDASNTKTINAYIYVKDSSSLPPGISIETFSDVPVVRVGGEGQRDMEAWTDGGNGYPGGTCKVMNANDRDFDVMPNYIWEFWYPGGFGIPAGWMLSKQGYYYLDNAAVGARNQIRSIVDKPWVQPTEPNGIPHNQLRSLVKVGKVWVATLKNNVAIVWRPRER